MFSKHQQGDVDPPVVYNGPTRPNLGPLGHRSGLRTLLLKPFWEGLPERNGQLTAYIDDIVVVVPPDRTQKPNMMEAVTT